MGKIYEFSPDDAYRFSQEQMCRTKQRGDELQFYDCPYCHGAGHGDKNTFSINLRTGQFKCLRASCGASGNMITLSRDFDFSLGTEVDEYYRPKKKFRKFKKQKESIKPREPAVAYLESRGISREVCERYRITTPEGKDNILVFPFDDENGITCFIKYRKMDFDKEKDKNKEWCERDCKPILFGMKQCNPDNPILVITEGQIDSLSVATAGIENAVSVPTGAMGFTWVPYCYSWVSQFEEIIVFGDYEKEHITLLEDMARRFPCKIRHVQPKDYRGCKDANEILQKYGAESVRDAIKNAKYLQVDQIIPLSEVQSVNIYDLKKLRTGILELDRILYGGIPFGQVCLVGGKRGEGKSTLTSQFMTQALEQGFPVFIYSGELPNYLFKSWFDFQIAGRHHIVENINDFGTPNRFITNSNQELINNWYSDKAYIYDNRIVERDEKEDLIKCIEKAIQQYGVQVILIDNLMTAMYLDEQKGSDKYDQQGKFVRELTKLALNYNVLIFLVAHQRKNNGMYGDANDEISGSGDITNLAGTTLCYRKGTKSELEDRILSDEQRKLIIAKNRLFGKVDLDGIVLNYDEKSKRIYTDSDSLDYEFGWNKTEDGFRSVSEEEMDNIPY